MDFRTCRSLLNLRLVARGGELGHICDIYFDDLEWRVRYLVDDTGRFRNGHKVLISPTALSRVGSDRRALYTDLTPEEIRQAPGVETHKPVSAVEEEKITRYFSWPVYWGSLGNIPPTLSSQTPLSNRAESVGEDSHLRSFREICGYMIEASDGPIGHLDDLIVDMSDWTIRYLVVEVAFFPKKDCVMLVPSWARRINWNDARIIVDVTRSQVKHAPRFDAHEPVNREHELKLYDYYGRPYYWK